MWGCLRSISVGKASALSSSSSPLLFTRLYNPTTMPGSWCLMHGNKARSFSSERACRLRSVPRQHALCRQTSPGLHAPCMHRRDALEPRFGRQRSYRTGSAHTPRFPARLCGGAHIRYAHTNLSDSAGSDQSQKNEGFTFMKLSKEKTCYDVLQIEFGATPAEVKRAYLKLSQVWHPDVSKEENAHDYFPVITTAYKTLSDPEQREIYDDVLRSQVWFLQDPEDWSRLYEMREQHRKNGEGSVRDVVEKIKAQTSNACWLCFMLFLGIYGLTAVFRSSRVARESVSEDLGVAPLSAIGGSLLLSGGAFVAGAPGKVFLPLAMVGAWGGRYVSKYIEPRAKEKKLMEREGPRFVVANSRILFEVLTALVLMSRLAQEVPKPPPVALGAEFIAVSIVGVVIGTGIARFTVSSDEVIAAAGVPEPTQTQHGEDPDPPAAQATGAANPGGGAPNTPPSSPPSAPSSSSSPPPPSSTITAAASSSTTAAATRDAGANDGRTRPPPPPGTQLPPPKAIGAF